MTHGLSHTTSSIRGVGDVSLTKFRRVQASNLESNNIKVTNATITNLKAVNASIVNASIQRAKITTATINYLSASYLTLDIAYVDSVKEGRLQWNSDDGTLEYGLPGGTVVLQVGQEHVVRARNTTGSTLGNGTVVYVSGAQGNRPLLDKAYAGQEPLPALTFGVTTEDIAHNANGYVTTQGLVRDVNTNGIPIGMPVFLSATPGEYTPTEPAPPRFESLVGFCLREHVSEGILLVRVEVVPKTRSLSDVKRQTASANGQFLRWSVASGLYLVGKTASYINYGATQGRLGYGLRAKDGAMEFKNRAGTWAAIS